VIDLHDSFRRNCRSHLKILSKYTNPEVCGDDDCNRKNKQRLAYKSYSNSQNEFVTFDNLPLKYNNDCFNFSVIYFDSESIITFHKILMHFLNAFLRSSLFKLRYTVSNVICGVVKGANVLTM